MPRYLSKFAAFKKTVKKGEQVLVQGPQGPIVQTLSDPIIAQFRQAHVTPWEREMAQQRFRFLGSAEGEDPVPRISAYDTDEEARRGAWSPELKKQIEDLLDAQEGPDYFRVEKPKMAPPWPKYDEIVPAGRRTLEHVAAFIAETTESLGLDPDAIIAYERENEQRQEVIGALEALKLRAETSGDILIQA